MCWRNYSPVSHKIKTPFTGGGLNPLIEKEKKMKRDMDLIRTILRLIESCEGSFGISSPTIEGYSESQITHHLRLLLDGGLIEVKNVTHEFQQEDLYDGINLTWDGQEFVNAARDNSLWKKAKEALIDSGVSFTVKSLLAWLKEQALLKAKELL